MPPITRRNVLRLLVAVPFALAAPAAAAAEPPLDLTVLTYNIRYNTPADGEDRWDNRKARIAELIKDHDPDLVGLQEALRGQLNDLSAALPAYGEIGVGRDDGKEAGEYAAILYRKERLEPLDSGTFWFSETPEVPGSRSWGNRVVRICTWARFKDRQTGRTVRIYNLHLDHESQPSRVKGVALLAERIAARGDDDPVIVTGDFNAAEDNPAIAAMKAPPAGLVDTFRLAHPEGPEAPEAGTFNNFGRPGGAAGKIDYIFVQPTAAAPEAGIDRRSHAGRFPSDHYAVWAKVRWP